MTDKMKFDVVDGGKALPNLLQGAWDVMIDDQPEDQADRLVFDGDEAHWNGQPVPLRFDGDRAIVDLGAYQYEVGRYYADPKRADRFDVVLIVGPGQKIQGLMDRVI